MLIHKEILKQLILLCLAQRIQQGCDIDKQVFSERIEAAADSYDALYEIALELRSPPTRKDWSYREPVAWDEIVAEWPICDYISQAFLNKLGRGHESAAHTVREKICAVAADDDIHYTIIGMLLLEENGLNFAEAIIRADLHEFDLNALAERMSLLPGKIYSEYQGKGVSIQV